ncbi:MAG: hypothetical protein EOP21_07195 [Hyphomicrobiales bacterium]|nr:MAG: hypothetical protein EOP21_07195 [Hyphomicrobiales bacterium]
MIADVGCKGLTVRGLAEETGYAVQTLYNRVGPRDQAISDAMSEYSIYVGRVGTPALDTPLAIPAIANMWLGVSQIRPDYSRECNLIFFTDWRHIYYRFRARQLRGMQTLLRRQQQCGILRSSCDPSVLAEHMVLFATSLWVDWADRPFAIGGLRSRLYSGFAHLLHGQISEEHAEDMRAHFTVFGNARSPSTSRRADSANFLAPQTSPTDEGLRQSRWTGDA